MSNVFQIGMVVSCILVIAVITVLMIVFSRKRNQADRALAEQIGFTHLNRPDPQLVEKVKSIYRISGTAKISNVSMKTTPDETVYLCNISYSDNHSDGGEVEYRSVCILNSRLNLPPFMMMYQFDQVYGPMGGLINGLLDKAIGMTGLQEVDFSHHPRFEAKYRVFTYQTEAVQQIFNDTLLENLSNTDNWLVRAEGDCICFNTYEMRRGKEITGAQLSQHIRDALQFSYWIAES